MVKEIIRQCIVTRERLLKDELLRFVLDPEGHVIPDIRGKLPGRGVWVKAQKKIVVEALERKAFSRGFRQPVTVRPDLPELIRNLLHRDCLSALSLAYRAGDVIIGAAKLLESIGQKPVIYVLHSSEAAEDGCRRLDKKFIAATNFGDRLSNNNSFFSCEQLSSALGQPKVVHIGFLDGNAAKRFIRLAKLLEHYQNDNI